MSLSKYETETVITFNDDSDNATVYTCHKRIMTMIEKRGIEPKKEYVNSKRVVAKQYEVPKKWVKIYPPRQVSESQREAARRNMAAMLKKDGSVPATEETE